MAKADMHVHSSFSARPSEWFLQKIGTRESYTAPETIYREALAQGMDFVTITDHNMIEGALLLKECYPERVFTGLEATTYFPDTGCKVHLLVYGLNESQFAVIDRVRKDIYQLREYIREQNLVHSVAHATYSINNRLTFEQIEKLLILFDCFEGINGSRGRHANEVLQRALDALTPEHMERLSRKYAIEPFSETPWVKGITGGTDDHGGLYIGKTYTEAAGASPAEFLQALARKGSGAGGRHNDYRGLAFSLYKIAYDFSQSHSACISSPLLSSINKLLFDRSSLNVKNRVTLKKVSCFRSGGKIEDLIAELIDTLQKNKTRSVDDTLDYVYDTVARLWDELCKQLCITVEESLAQGNILLLAQRISSALPGLFLTLPFFTTLQLLHESRALLTRLDGEYGGHDLRAPKKILWFTDAPQAGAEADMLYGAYAERRGYAEADNIVVICGDPDAADTGVYGDTLLLPSVYGCEVPFGTRCTLHVPPVLHAVKRISEINPDEIVVTSPGPVGLLGLLVSKLLHVPSAGVAGGCIPGTAGHTEFSHMADRYYRWFYAMTDVQLDNLGGAADLDPFAPARDVPEAAMPDARHYGLGMHLPVLKEASPA
jgi:predicted metal-dependent phosphoesterase TrpH